MSKFNSTNTIKTTNKSGHVAYKMEDKEKLVTQVLTSFLGEPKFYGDNSNELAKTAEIVVKNEPKFVANLARYARKELHFRSVSHFLTALIANCVESKPYIKEVVADVVERPDDITEILSCYLKVFGKPIPNGLKKALAESLCKFNEYLISKYNGGNKELKFKDVLRLIHPKPKNEEQQELFNKIINDTLPTAVRWETELSQRGNKTEVWEDLIENNKLGYMAMLRNLRNIMTANPKNIDKVWEKLSDKDEVLKSKLLPFRFYTAYREAFHLFTSKNIDLLETAMQHTIDNLPKINGKTVIAIDVSGSMRSLISRNSSVNCAEIAKLLAILAGKLCEEVIIYKFDTKITKVDFSTKDRILKSVKQLWADGGGTNIALPIQEMIDNKIEADRLIIFSDNEINYGFKSTCQSLIDEYRKNINPELWVHAIDLLGYGTQQFCGKNTNIIAGWSEQILEFINTAEQGIATQVQKIENY